VANEQERQWLYKEYERIMEIKLSNAERVNINHYLIQGEAIDHYLHKKFTTFVMTY
jgi:probable 2-oxoglutarate dehydrogenase E1 component DHKTD1